MSVKTETCIVISCDDCGDDCHDEGVPHFKTMEEARERFINGEDEYDWTITDDLQVCASCTHSRLCAAEGHRWSEWSPTFAWDPMGGGLAASEVEEYRYCHRCSSGSEKREVSA